MQAQQLVDANSGFNLIDNVEVEIGGQCIDKHYGDWMTVWTDLTHGSDKKASVRKIRCDDDTSQNRNSSQKLHTSSILVLQKSRSCTSSYCTSISRSQA